MNKLFFTLIFIIITACELPSLTEIAREDCTGFGFKPETEKFAECVMERVGKHEELLYQPRHYHRPSFHKRRY